MHEFFTADLHFGHPAIIGYCDRPFRDVDHMNARLIANINERCTENDILYHLGDFLTYGRAKGVEGLREKASYYLDQIKPTVIHCMGNHDKQNGLKVCVRGMRMQLYKRSVWAQHHPPWQFENVPEACAYLCGHVHEKWKTVRWQGKPVINVGCDVWNWRPVRKDELAAIFREVPNA